MTRIEKDSMGELAVPESALYGAQTQRAVNNFAISHKPMPQTFIRSLILIKQAAASANGRLGLLEQDKAKAIESACQQLLQQDFMAHFPVDVFQTGSGTSSNMNANEVIARLGQELNDVALSPNDDINMGQSSNDVIPSCIQVSAALSIQRDLLPALTRLISHMDTRARELDKVVKTGRTHLMDAMPVTLGQSINAWKHQLTTAKQHIEGLLPALTSLPQGGTAVGTGINAHPEFAPQFSAALNKLTQGEFKPADNLFYGIGTQDVSVAVSGQLKALAVAMMKIANDLRWMNSGPLAGLGEIALPALQPGSSIMPGKVNPVIPEAVAMACAQVIGNDAAITIGGQSANFELNVMLPMIATNLLESIQLLANSADHLGEKAIAGFTVNHDNIEKALAKNPILVTALNPVVGYLKAAQIAKKAYAENRAIIDVALEETDLTEAQLKTMLDPHRLTQGGIQQQE